MTSCQNTKNICPKCRGTGHIQEMLVEDKAKKALFFTDARCPECNGSDTAANKG